MDRTPHRAKSGKSPVPLSPATRDRVTLLVLEDDTTTNARRGAPGVVASVRDVIVRLHRVDSKGTTLLGEATYVAGDLVRRVGRSGKASVALKLIEKAHRSGARGVIVAGPSYGCNKHFVGGLHDRSLPFVVQIRPTTALPVARGGRSRAISLLRSAAWEKVAIRTPGAPMPVPYLTAELSTIETDRGRMRVFAAQPGGIQEVHRGTIVGLASTRLGLSAVARAACWPGFIRRVLRATDRIGVEATRESASTNRSEEHDRLPARANISLGIRQDERRKLSDETSRAHFGRGILARNRDRLRVVELFAGAGGMGLGFLLAGDQKRKYDLIFSGEVHPTYVATLRQNHRTFAATSQDGARRVPTETVAVDLRSKRGKEIVATAARDRGVDLIIGGPPCQGFSMANRNSGNGANPHNKLVETFLEHVAQLQPAAFLMENVQGMLWTAGRSSRGKSGVVGDVARRMARAGYLVFPKLLDAAWYGVPQFRSRFFLLGLHADLGYREEDFGEWGPFPRPTHGPNASRSYATVRDAFSDLPSIPNGQSDAELPYEEQAAKKLLLNPFLRAMRAGAPAGVISDHVTSRHARYVLHRYRAIPPGGNWRDIADRMTNYANVERTHSNIYRRLHWDEPSITIGHYRKSMIVHPSQHRGLSLREAARLQSFPDWFRFAGTSDGRDGGLVHKQQQLANAVCPLVTRAIANFVLSL